MFVPTSELVPQLILLIIGIFTLLIATFFKKRVTSDRVTGIAVILILTAIIWFFIEINSYAEMLKNSIKILQ